MKEKILLTDADGVLVSWIDGFHSWMKSNGYSIVDESKYEIHEKYGISRKEGNKLCYQFSHSNEIMTLRPFDDARKYVRKIHYDLGYKVRVITSLTDDVRVQRLRRVNLESTFGPIFDDILCLPHGDNKFKALSRYVDSEYIWVEDKNENAHLGTNLGLYSFLIDRPYNQTGHPQSEYFYQRVKSWKEIYDHIVALESE